MICRGLQHRAPCAFSVATQFTVSTGKRESERPRGMPLVTRMAGFKRTCVGSNGILEFEFLSENAHRTQPCNSWDYTVKRFKRCDVTPHQSNLAYTFIPTHCWQRWFDRVRPFHLVDIGRVDWCCQHSNQHAVRWQIERDLAWLVCVRVRTHVELGGGRTVNVKNRTCVGGREGGLILLVTSHNPKDVLYPPRNRLNVMWLLEVHVHGMLAVCLAILWPSTGAAYTTQRWVAAATSRTYEAE
jgi:hypothetical protein